MSPAAATLGCAQSYTVRVHTRGGSQEAIRGELTGYTALDWGRDLDESSDLTVRFPRKTLPRECCRVISDLNPWTHELVVHRDAERFWEGPVIDVTEDGSGIEIHAQDVIAYLDGRVNHTAYNFINTDVVAIAAAIVTDGLSGGLDPWILPFLYQYPTGGGYALDWEVTQIASVTIANQLRALARVGLDFSAVGRTLRLTGEAGPNQLPHAALTDTDFTGPLEVTRPGADSATRVYARGEGVAADYTPYPPSGVSATYGLLERIVSVPGVTDPYAIGVAATIAQAQLAPTRAIIRVPPSVALQPWARLPLRELVCGNRINVTASTGCLRFGAGYRLAAVRGTWTPQARTPAAREQIKISLAPLSATGYIGEAS